MCKNMRRNIRGDSIISLVFMLIVFFAGRADPNYMPPIPFELAPKAGMTYQQIVWWVKHWPFLYRPRIVQTADLWPVGSPDGRVDLRDWAVFANSWLTEK